MANSFELHAIDIGFAPDPDIVDSRSYVGVPIWMWVESPTEDTFGPLEQVTPLGGFSVTATAQVTSILWNMGDGTTVACAGVGTPFVVAYGAVDSPTCGHRYARTSNAQPGGEYTVTATSQWSVTWSGGGQSGVIPLTTESSTTVDINELQSVNVGSAR
ncbi:ATP/GTP-binding protein [Cryobacterium melibiosiphilum]|uniref:ATP/GTP-binding protein n=2 Tax=Cryobacterium melibiosiphilum TaxID=995039 RepID=A0A3A5M7Z8_9MICO|nr:ATP/GTP-binding protein [Cryobacterium melibiosiphilum]